MILIVLIWKIFVQKNSKFIVVFDSKFMTIYVVKTKLKDIS
jgi:hypothetical protein